MGQTKIHERFPLHRPAFRGLDSATAAALALQQGHRVIGLSFDYGQRHKRELQAAERIAAKLGLEDHHCIQVNLSAWGVLPYGSTSEHSVRWGET